MLGAERGRPGGVYFVTDGEPVVFRDFVTELLGTQGVTPGDRNMPAPVARAMAAGVRGRLAHVPPRRQPADHPPRLLAVGAGVHDRHLAGAGRAGLRAGALDPRGHAGTARVKELTCPSAPCYIDEARYLPEWLEFHRLVGVERFFLYNNNSTRQPPARCSLPTSRTARSCSATGAYCSRARTTAFRRVPEGPLAHDSRWIEFHDLDEFLFSLDRRDCCPTSCATSRSNPGVVVNSIFHGTLGSRDAAGGPRDRELHAPHRAGRTAQPDREEHPQPGPRRCAAPAPSRTTSTDVDRKKAVTENRQAVAD